MTKTEQLKLKLQEQQEALKSYEGKIAKLEAAGMADDATIVDPIKKMISSTELSIRKLEGEIKDAVKLEAMQNVDWSTHKSAIVRDAWETTNRIHKEVSFTTRKVVNKIMVNALKSSEKDRVALLLEGPTGTGKTTAVKWVGGEINRPVISQNFSANMEEQDVLGGPTVLADGSVVMKDGPLVEAMRHGCVYVAEEMNFAKPAVIGVLNSVLDGNQQAVLPSGEIVKASPGFKFVGTVNPKYAGTRDFNVALINRFGCVIKFNRPTEEQLMNIVISATGYGNNNVDEFVTLRKLLILMGAIEKVITKEDYDAAISVRQLISTVRFLQDGEGFNKSVEYGLMSQVSNLDDELATTIMNMCKKTDSKTAAELNIDVSQFDGSK